MVKEIFTTSSFIVYKFLYSSSFGGGERVLWEIIMLISQSKDKMATNIYVNTICDSSIKYKVRSYFDLEVSDSPKEIEITSYKLFFWK
jgi:hypothetical protein